MDVKIKSLYPSIRIPRTRRRKRKRGRKLFNGKDPRLVARHMIRAFLSGCNDKGVAGYAGISLSAYYRYMRKTRGKELLLVKDMMRRKRTIEERLSVLHGIGEIKINPIDLDLSQKSDGAIWEKSEE